MIDRREFLTLAAISAGYAAMSDIGLAAADDSRKALTIAVQDLRTVLEPIDESSIANVAWRVQYSIFDQLLRTDYNDNFRLHFALAETVKQINETTYEVTLRRGVKFHNGAEMTADDVVFSLGHERLLGDKAPGAAVKANFLSSFDSIEKLAADRVQITTKSPDPVFLKRLGAWGTQIISAEAWRGAKSYSDWAQRPIGTGPYRIAQTNTGDSILLEAHDAYWGGRPPFKSIRFKKVPEIAARIAGLQSGDYDIVTDITPDHMNEIDGKPGLEVLGGNSAWFRFLTFSARKCAPLKDVRVRQAIALSIDRNALAHGLWDGRASVPSGWQLPIFGDLNDASRPPLSFDPDRARQLLASASYRGEEIPYPTVGNYYPMQFAENQALVEMWKAVGLNVKLVMCENWDQVANIPGIFDESGGAFYADPIATLWQIIGPTNGLQSNGDWSSSEFNSLGDELGSTVDLAHRKQIWQRMQDIVDRDDPPITPLHSMPFIYGKKAGIDWMPTPLPQMYLGPSLPSEPVI
ncbi:ABC transporter substrate-binding protein [Rhizobium mayense]|uniref:ABC transporter substrate-binding protein n=1 Tax=Rhizobium mayense TaxID=1312184 RepID=A0ABT7K4N2_9HYPH|nr:ABC transporter substrate-binding protein [Rhizobium mayense]MDL2403466.1 ABC transporter substrate-binding protein [Rhizobium mayense]